jgi:hypothetical protein
MNLPYIQTELFRELVSMEPLFETRCTWFITRHANQDLEIKLFALSTDNSWEWDNPRAGHGGYYHYYRRIRQEQMLTFKNQADIVALINTIWEELPDWCKKQTARTSQEP